MVQATNKNYWISPYAVYTALNALDNPDYMQVTITSGATILCYMPNIEGLGYSVAHNYQSWVLSGDNVAFSSGERRYVYVRIPRSPESIAKDPICQELGIIALQDQIHAQLCYPPQLIDIYGCTEADKEGNTIQLGTRDYFYIFLGGIIASSTAGDIQVDRTWLSEIDFGLLSSDAARDPDESEWFKYSPVQELTTFLKDLTMKAGTKFIQLFARTLTIVSGGKIAFGEKDTDPYINGIATTATPDGVPTPSSGTPISSTTHIVTPAYGEDQWLSKTHDDTAEGNMTFKSDVDIFGNTTIKKDLDVSGNTTIKKNLDVSGTSHLKGSVTIGSPSTIVPDTSASGSTPSTTVPAGSPAGIDTQHWGASKWGAFVKGIITGSGGQIDISGNAELESLVLRKFLEVPELRYNRVSVHSGTDWFTKGSGLIESVTPDTDADGNLLNTGTITLHLEDGEFGTVAVDDFCMGIFHNLEGNATETIDDHHGILQYKGFTTVYFRITSVSGNHNETLTYTLRPATVPSASPEGSTTVPDASASGWSSQVHPQPQMTFAAYANPSDTTRQSAVLRTTDYTVYMENLTNWTFGPDNYYLILGNLEGFSVYATNQAGNRYLKELHGNGTMLGNVYQFGTIDQFDRLADHIDVSASPITNSDFTLAEGETLTLTAKMLSFDNIQRTGVTYGITRISSSAESDAEWNAAHATAFASGSMSLTIADIGDDSSVLFRITATRSIPKGTTTEPYTITRDIVIKNVGRASITADITDPFLVLEQPKHIVFSVRDARGGDITSSINLWTIQRHSTNPTADTAWAQRDKATHFNGSIDLVWSDTPSLNDLDPDETVPNTAFEVTAYIDDTPVARTITSV